MSNVAAYLFCQVLLWRVYLIFPVALVGDFGATYAVWLSPRNRRDVTKRAQTRPGIQAFVVLCLLDFRVIPVAWLYVSRVRDALNFAVCGVAWFAGK